MGPGEFRSLFAEGTPAYQVGCACGCGAAIVVHCKLLAEHPTRHVAARAIGGNDSQRMDEWMLAAIDFWRSHGPDATFAWSWKDQSVRH